MTTKEKQYARYGPHSQCFKRHQFVEEPRLYRGQLILVEEPDELHACIAVNIYRRILMTENLRKTQVSITLRTV